MRTKVTTASLCLLLLITILVALTNGASAVNLFHLTTTSANTLFTIRLPRVIAALVAGATVSVSGALLQAALRNPIADPGIMGISSGANVFAAIRKAREEPSAKIVAILPDGGEKYMSLGIYE